jgi:translation initiation factor 4E
MSFHFNQDLSLGEEPIPLQTAWTFWHDKYQGPSQSASDYEPNLRELCTFDTVQGFWNCFNVLPSVNELKTKSSYHLMRKGIKPIWEDPENAQGGMWSIRIKKEDSEFVWREMAMAVVGEQFATVLAPDDDICGITISIRKTDNILQVWNKKAATNTQKILDRIEALLPKIELSGSFYKACAQHNSFDPEFIKKLQSAKGILSISPETSAAEIRSPSNPSQSSPQIQSPQNASEQSLPSRNETNETKDSATPKEGK